MVIAAEKLPPSNRSTDREVARVRCRGCWICVAQSDWDTQLRRLNNYQRAEIAFCATVTGAPEMYERYGRRKEDGYRDTTITRKCSSRTAGGHKTCAGSLMRHGQWPSKRGKVGQRRITRDYH